MFAGRGRDRRGREKLGSERGRDAEGELELGRGEVGGESSISTTPIPHPFSPQDVVATNVPGRVGSALDVSFLIVLQYDDHYDHEAAAADVGAVLTNSSMLA